MSTELKNDFEKIFLKQMNNAGFRKTMENVRTHRDIKLAEGRRNYLVSEPNYHAATLLSEKLLAIEMEKKHMFVNKPAHLDLSILELTKIVMYKFQYHYVKPKYGENAELCYMDTNSFIVYIKTEDIDSDIAKYVKLDFISQIMNYIDNCLKEKPRM